MQNFRKVIKVDLENETYKYLDSKWGKIDPVWDSERSYQKIGSITLS